MTTVAEKKAAKRARRPIYMIVERLVDPASYLATMRAIAEDPECVTDDRFELADVGRAFQRTTGASTIRRASRLAASSLSGRSPRSIRPNGSSPSQLPRHIICVR